MVPTKQSFATSRQVGYNYRRRQCEGGMSMLTIFDRDRRMQSPLVPAHRQPRAGRPVPRRPARARRRPPRARAARHRQVGHLPVPARRAEPDRDLRPEDDRARPNSAAPPAKSRRTLPGVTFGGTFPRLAAPGRQARHRPLVRHRRRQPRHQAGRRPRHLRRQPRLDLRARRRPQPSGHRHADQRRCSSRAPSIRARSRAPRTSASFGAHRQPRHRPTPRSTPAPAATLQKDMQLNVPLDRLDDRRQLLAQLDQRAVAARRGAAARRHGPRPRAGLRRPCSAASPMPSTCRRKTRASSPATTPRRWSGPRTSTGSGTTTTTTSTTPSRSASCCCWPAGCASAAAASSPSPPTSSGTCTPT